ncbi:hypothetical protein FQN51_007657 [Onygenales sp. PD_10]|nr:hypothetical protein FQN51_007657 [Onygenales sp. PD_10]
MARHRHEASLEGLSNFSTPEPLPPSDMVLRAFFDAMGLDMQVGNIDFDHDGDQLRENLASFAEFLMNEPKQPALRILNMVDHNISHPINGFSIGREFNAMSLASNLLIYFGKFQIFFDPVLREEHTYHIDTFLLSFILAEFQIPATRTLYPLHDRSIEPSPRLLALHRAIAYILHLSSAGEYIDMILRDMEELGTREGGGTELSRLVTLRLGGWLTGAADS